MRAGSLDRSIQINRIKFAPDDDGVMREVVFDVIPMRAAVVDNAANEITSTTGIGTHSEFQTKFRIRFLANLELRDTIGYCGRIFDIRNIKELGRRQGLEITAVARGNDASKVTQ